MARPKTNTVDYFSHPVKNGTRMFIMEQNYGDKGYVAYYKILELLGAAEGHFLDFKEEKNKLFFASSIRSDLELMDKILLTLSEIGAIDKQLWVENRVVWCQEFVDKLSELYGKRGRIMPQKPSFCPRNDTSPIQSGPETTQSKGKESKIEEIKVNDIKDRKLKFSETLKKFLSIYEKEMLLDFYYYWTEENKSETKFRKELQKTWDLEGRLRTWARNDKNFKNGNGKQNSYNSNKTDVASLVEQTKRMLEGDHSNDN